MVRPSARSFSARLRKLIRDHVFDVDHVIYFEMPLDREPRRVKQPDGTKVHRATNEVEIRPLAEAFPKRAKYFLSYMSQGASAFFLVRQGTVLGYIFATTKDFYDRFLWKNTVSVKPGQFFHFAGFMSPGRRGSISTIFLFEALLAHYRERGYTTATTTISARNEQSWRLCLGMGYVQKPVAWDVYKLFGLRWSRPTDVRVWVKLPDRGKAGTKAQSVE